MTRLFEFRDFRYAARGLWRAPTVTICAVLSLGLGLGATSAIFSAFDRALLQPLPFRDPGRLVTVFRTTPHFNTGPFSAPNFLDLAARVHKLSDLASASGASLLLSEPESGVRVPSLRVTGNLFPMLGIQALRGRLLEAADDRPGAAAVVVVSAELWHKRFGSDSSLVGRSLLIDGVSRTVVGITPLDLRIPHNGGFLTGDFFVPMQFTRGEQEQRDSNWLPALGRLAPGVTLASADAELRTVFDGIVAEYPQLRGEQVRLVSLQDDGAQPVRRPLALVLGAVLFVLLISASNVASLLLARAADRRRELAIRTTLGGSRGAVVRPVLAESLLLAALGALAGILLATVGVRTIGVLAAARLPQLAGLSVDMRVLGVAIGLALLVALACGAVPAWTAASVDPQDALRGGRGGGPGREHYRALGSLVIAEVALSLVLLLGAGLVTKGFLKLMSRDPGFDPGGVITLEATISPEQYPNGETVQGFLEPALAAIRDIRGVKAAGAIQAVPYLNWGWNFNIRYEGQSGEDRTRLPITEIRTITPGFFDVTGQKLLGGRRLEQSDDDRPGSPAVAVVNQALVRRDFPHGDPLGKRFHTGDTTYATIVGVVSDIQNFGPAEDPRPEVYWTFRQAGQGTTTFPIMIRTNGDASLERAAAAAIHSVNPGAAVASVMPMTEVIARSLGRPRFYLVLLAVFAGIAVLLSMAGLYGLISYSVAQRTREIGVRTALGSTPGATVWFVARRGLNLVATGLVIGLLSAAFMTRLLQGLLYGISPLDPITWASAAALLVVAGMLAAIIPARRASRIDPLVAMRQE